MECLSSDGVDHLGSLPDELLGKIVSFLPTTKDAVVTSVLSRRWRHLYTYWVTSLNFEYLPDVSHCLACPHLAGKFDLFKKFVDSVVQSCQSEKLTKFRMILSKGMKQDPHCVTGNSHTCELHENYFNCFPVLEYSLTNSWLSFALSCKVRELELCVHMPDSAPDEESGTLFGSVFSSEMLEVLKLDFKYNRCMHKEPLSVCLPHLKVLHLRLECYIHEDLINNLVAGCPMLEDLAVEGHCWCPSKNINISSASLQKLVLDIEVPFTEPDYRGRIQIPRSNFVLNTPNLQHLTYSDNIPSQYCIGNLDDLMEAEIRFPQPPSPTDENLRILISFLRSLTHTRHLSLDCFTIVCFDVVNVSTAYQLPRFENLTHLELLEQPNCHIPWCKVILLLLNCSPYLETLSFPQNWDSFGREPSNEDDNFSHLQHWDSFGDEPSNEDDNFSHLQHWDSFGDEPSNEDDNFSHLQHWDSFGDEPGNEDNTFSHLQRCDSFGDEPSNEDTNLWTTQEVPSCVTYHLKRIVIQSIFSRKESLETIKYFIKNALVLEELVLNCDYKPDRILIEEALRESPRGSLACIIEIIG